MNQIFRALPTKIVLAVALGATILAPQFRNRYLPNATAKSVVVPNFTQREVAIRADDLQLARPQYNLNARVDFQKRTLGGTARISAPIKNGDSLRDVVFFLYANGAATNNAMPTKPNIVIESVTQNGKPLKWQQSGAVLRATFASLQTKSFALTIRYRGVVPLAPPQSEGLAGMLGGLDLGDILGGGATSSTRSKPEADYGLFSKSGDILSLGSWWYPSLAVRQNGKWQDKAPVGVGDVAFSETADFIVHIYMPKLQKVKIATTGQEPPTYQGIYDGRIEKPFYFGAQNVRDFAVVMSDKYQSKSKTFDVGGKSVLVTAFTTPQNAKKTDEAIEVAGRALQIFSKRFGAYPNSQFTIAEAPLRGGAGGIEYSNMTGIASMLYGDLGKQVDDLVAAMGANASMLGGVLDEQKAVLNTTFEMTIAHEVAHQWWAMGVGSDSQNAPWVDESLTNYCATIYFEDRYGASRAQQMRDAHLKSAFTMARMLGVADAPVRGATSAFGGNFQYGAIVYGKGALFYGELRKLLGDEVFFQSLRNYYATYNGKLANENSLKNIVIANAPIKKAAVEKLYTRWLDELRGDEDLGTASLFGGANASNSPEDLSSVFDAFAGN